MRKTQLYTNASIFTCRFVDGLEAAHFVPPEARVLIASRFAEDSENIAATSDVAIVPALTNECNTMEIAGVESEEIIFRL